MVRVMVKVRVKVRFRIQKHLGFDLLSVTSFRAVYMGDITIFGSLLAG